MAKLTVLMGAPGAGKSTYASRFQNVVTNDTHCGRPDQAGETLHMAYRQINQLLAQGKDVVFDTTGANPNVRKAAVSIARKHGAQVDAHVLNTPLDTCLAAQKGRRAPVAPADVRRIHGAVEGSIRQLKSEGFANVRVTRDRR